jgi:hypothetical protein
MRSTARDSTDWWYHTTISSSFPITMRASIMLKLRSIPHEETIVFPGPARGNRSDTLKLSAALKLGAALKLSFGAPRRQGETEASRRQGIRGKERGVRVMVRFM